MPLRSSLGGFIGRFPDGPFSLNHNTPQARGLIHWWPLRDDLRDYALPDNKDGNLDGTLIGDARLDGDYQRGKAIYVDGVGDQSDMGNVNLGGRHVGFLGSAWVYYDSSGTDEHTIFSNWGGANAAWVMLRLEPSDDTVEAFVRVNGPANLGGTFSDLVAPINAWCHVAMAFNITGDQTVHAYLNGVKSSTTFGTGVARSENADNTFRIGATPHNSIDDLTGRISDVRIYLNVASPDALVRAMHNPRTRWDLYKPVLPHILVVPPAAPAAGQPMMLRGTTVPHMARQWHPRVA